ncbi:MAG: 50S ribosomal protein L29 [Bacteroidales bacterium]|nr:50S ribosomal protein L29 [Bacteroidales bacterium]
MKQAEIKELSPKELLERIEVEKANLHKLKLNHTVSPLDNPLKIRKARRDVARLLNELRMRQIAESKKS